MMLLQKYLLISLKGKRMIFNLSCVKYFFSEEEMLKYSKLGFNFLPNPDKNDKDDDLKYVIDMREQPKIIFHDIENLKLWVKTFNLNEIIISFDPNELEIYDDYRE